MPASMISAPTGSMPKVIGSSIVMVAMGPTPGSTPIKVPIMQPRKHRPRFLTDSATVIPNARFPTRLAKKSIAAASTDEQAFYAGEHLPDARFHPGIGVVDGLGDQARRVEGDGQVEQLLEQESADQGHQHAEHDDLA